MALKQLSPPYPIFTDKGGDPLDNGYLYFGEINKNPETKPIKVYYDSAFTQPAAQPVRTSSGYVMRNGSPTQIYADSGFSLTIRNKKNALVIYSPVGYGIDPATAVSGSAAVQGQTGDGTTVTFGMGATPNSINATNVYIDGIYQEKNTYTIGGNNITFSQAPPVNSSIEIISVSSPVIGGTSAGQVSYNQGGASSINRTVQSKLQETASVKDFGALGDGDTDDTAAIQAAINALADGNDLYFPRGRYIVSSTLYCAHRNFRMFGESSPTQDADNQQIGSILDFSQTTTQGLLFEDLLPVPSTPTRRIDIENMGFVGSTTSIILQFDDAAQINIENVFVDNQSSGNGIEFLRGSIVNTKNLSVFKSTNARATGSIGILITPRDTAHLDGIYNFQSTTVRRWETGLKINGSYTAAGDQRWKSFNWHGSQTEANSVGIDLVGNIQSGTITGSYFEGDILTSLQMSQGVENFFVAGNFFNSEDTESQINLGLATGTNEGYVRNITLLSNNHTNISDRGVWIRTDDTFASGIKIENCYFEGVTGAPQSAGIVVGGNPTATRIQSCNFKTLSASISGSANALYVDDVGGHFIRPVNRQDLTATLNLAISAPRIQSFNPTTGDINIYVPPEAISQGKEFLITNRSVDNRVVVGRTGVGVVVAIGVTDSALVWNDGTTWYGKVL